MCGVDTWETIIGTVVIDSQRVVNAWMSPIPSASLGGAGGSQWSCDMEIDLWMPAAFSRQAGLPANGELGQPRNRLDPIDREQPACRCRSKRHCYSMALVQQRCNQSREYGLDAPALAAMTPMLAI